MSDCLLIYIISMKCFGPLNNYLSHLLSDEIIILWSKYPLVNTLGVKQLTIHSLFIIYHLATLIKIMNKGMKILNLISLLN